MEGEREGEGGGRERVRAREGERERQYVREKGGRDGEMERWRERAREIVCVRACVCERERDGERYVRECKHARETFAIYQARIPSRRSLDGRGRAIE